MPKLPTADDITRAIPTAPRQIVTYQPGIADQALGQFADTLHAVVKQEKDRLDDIRAEDALNKAKMAALELSEGDNGFTKQKGEAVVKTPLRQDYTKRFTEKLSEIEKDLTPEQAARFKRRVQPLSLNYQSSLLNHIGRETDSYQDQTDLATIQIETADAAANWQDSEAIAGAKARIQYTLNSAAERKGLSPEAKKQLLSDKMTELHKGVISSMLVSAPSEAKSYYQQYKKEINGLERDNIEKAIKAGSVKAESQALSDDIMAKNLSYQDALKAARKSKDPDVREDTVTLIKQRYNEMRTAEQDAVRVAGQYVAENRSLDGLDPKVRELLPAQTVLSLQKTGRALREGEEPLQNHQEWAKFNAMVGRAVAGDKEAISELKSKDMFSEYYMKFDNAHYDQAVGIQRAFVTNDAREKAKAGVSAGQILTHKAAADSFINSLLGREKNGDRNKNDIKFADQFYQLAQTQIERWGDENPGKKIPPSERDEIFRGLAESMTINDPIEFMGVPMFDWEKEMDISDIPTELINEISDDLRSEGIPVTGRNIVNAYLAEKAAGKK